MNQTGEAGIGGLTDWGELWDLVGVGCRERSGSSSFHPSTMVSQQIYHHITLFLFVYVFLFYLPHDNPRRSTYILFVEYAAYSSTVYSSFLFLLFVSRRVFYYLAYLSSGLSFY